MSERPRTALAAAALAVAVLGWTPLGEAARTAVFPPNSVGTAQLRGNAVTSPKIRNGSVTGIDVQKRTLTAVHIKPGSLLGSNFKAGQLPAGPKGDKGDKGDRGANGAVSAYTKLTGTGVLQSLSPSDATLVSLALPAGRYSIDGRVVISWEPGDTLFFGICRVVAGTKSDAVNISGSSGENLVSSMNLLVELAAPATVSLLCHDTALAQSRWSRARLTALEVDRVVEQ